MENNLNLTNDNNHATVCDNSHYVFHNYHSSYRFWNVCVKITTVFKKLYLLAMLIILEIQDNVSNK